MPSVMRPRGSATTGSPSVDAGGDLDAAADFLAERHDALLGLAVLDDVDAAGAADGLDRGLGNGQRGRRLGLLNQCGREQARLEPAVLVRRDRLDRQRALIDADRRRDEADRGGELLAGIGVDGQAHRLSDLDLRDRLLGHGELDAQRIDADDRGDPRALGDVVADADRALGDEAGERRPDRRCRRPTCSRATTRARAACSERYDCSATFSATLYCWRAASTCVRR